MPTGIDLFTGKNKEITGNFDDPFRFIFGLNFGIHHDGVRTQIGSDIDGEVTGKPIDQLTLQVLNALGATVFERSINFTSGQLTTDINLDVPSGNYMLMVQHGQNKTYRKLSIVE